MPLLTSTHLVLLHGLTDQAGQAASPPQVVGLLAHLVECNFMVLILAVLFLLNRERKHRYHHLRAMCRHDAISGLDNAHALREAWRTSPTKPAALGFLLLDQVERVLGSYGWRAQSQLLREIGREMVPLARPYHMGADSSSCCRWATKRRVPGPATWRRSCGACRASCSSGTACSCG